MGGVQQIDKLIRKNFLQKARRPKSTCFECILPLALFALLAQMRREYDTGVGIEVFGPYTYEHQHIFPLSRRLQSTGDRIASSWTEALEIDLNKIEQILPGLGHQLLCDTSLLHAVTNVMEPIFSMNASFSRTVADDLLDLDINGTARTLGDMVRIMQGWNASDLVRALQVARLDYFNSSWPKQIEEAARSIDHELAILRSDLQGNASGLLRPAGEWANSSTAAARTRVRGWLSDVCNLQGPMLDVWNASDLAPVLARLRDALISSGSWGLTNGSHADWFNQSSGMVDLSWTTGWLSQARNILDPMWLLKRFNISSYDAKLLRFMGMLDSSYGKVNMSLLMGWLNSSRNEVNVSRLMGSVDWSELMAWVDEHRGMVSISQLAGWINRASGALDSPELLEWLNRTHAEVTVQGLMVWLDVQGLLPQHGLGGNHTRIELEEILRDLVGQAQEQMQTLQGLDLREEEPWAHEAVWWTSHFLEPGSPLSCMLTADARMASSPARNYSSYYRGVRDRGSSHRAFESVAMQESWSIDTSREVAALRRIVGNLRVAINATSQALQHWEQLNITAADWIWSGLDSLSAQALTDALFKAMEQWEPMNTSTAGWNHSGHYGPRSPQSFTNTLHEVMDHWKQLNESMANWQHELTEHVARAQLFADGLMARLRWALANLSGLNATAIKHEVLPAWKQEWRAECDLLNSDEVTDIISRMLQQSLFYPARVEDFANASLTDIVRDLHRTLEEVNATALQEKLASWQRMLRHLDPAELEATTHRLLASVQRAALQEQTPRALAHNFAKAAQAELLRHLKGFESLECKSGDSLNFTDWLADAGMAAIGLGSMLGDDVSLTGEYEGKVWGGDDDDDDGDDNDDADDDDDDKDSGRRDGKSQSNGMYQDYLQSELLRRKFLIAPFKGEVRELWDLMLVELVTSATATEHGSPSNMSFVSALLRCPLVRGLATKELKRFLEDRVLTFGTERDLEAFAMERPDDVFAAIVFRGADEATGNFAAHSLNVEYAVRFHAQLMPSTARIVSWTRNAMFGGASWSRYAYIDIGFAYLQETIGRAAARLRAKRETAASAEGSTFAEAARNVHAQNATAMLRRLAVGAQQFPTPQYQVDGFIYAIQYLLPMFMILGWIYAVSLLVKEIVYEKQERLREVMRIQGLRTWVYWASWIIFAMAQLLVLVTAMTIIICGSGVLRHSDPFLVFLFFLIYSGSVVSFSMMISACFLRAKVASVCAGVAYYSAYLPYSLYNRFEETLSLGGKCSFCLLCPSGLGIGMSMIAKWEVVEDGLQWSNIGLPPPITNTGAKPNNDFSLAHVVMMMFVDMCLYQVAAWYIEKVFPGELGLPQPWYFPFLPSFWQRAPVVASNSCSDSMEKDSNPKLECYEAAPPNLPVVVQIRGLTKAFRNGKKALKGITLDMHSGTILGLLGHNGAGKSTTMSILTGLYPPSEGDVLVNGCSVRRDSCGVRKQLGVCLQQNALYECLTVAEHLDIFCNLKSVPRGRVAAEVDALLRDTGLVPKRNAPTRALSGGMKRKLSIGIALAGGSRVIALDEPTAGVDATSRRDIWHLLAAHKPQRAILLSTHFMDEADVLSDRIAIIAEGRLTAIGSSIALKKRFADRYLLTLVASDGADPAQLLAAVRLAVPAAKCVGSRGREFGYELPSSARLQFAELFAKLQDDDARTRLGVETYGLSATTMEEVFLNASSLHEEGLHGMVRNGAEAVSDGASDDVSTASGSGSGSRPTSALPGSRPTSASTPGTRRPREDASPSSTGAAGGQLSPNDACSQDESSSNPESGDNGEPTSDADAKPVAETGPMPQQCTTDSRSQELTETRDTKSPKKEPATAALQSPLSVDCGPLLTGAPLLWQQFRARIWTRAVSAFRDRKAWASQLMLPASFVLLALVIAAALQVRKEEPALRLATDMFIGTVSGGSASLEEHTIPFLNQQGSDLGEQAFAAFEAARGTDDVLQPIGGGWDGMGGYLVENKKEVASRSYGAVSVAPSEAGADETANLTLWFENKARHAIPAMLHLCNNARLRMLGYDDTLTQAWNHPLPKTAQLLGEQLTGSSQVFTDLTVAITVLLAMGFIPASFLVYLVHEKVTNAKHQQLLTGVSPVMYWVSSYCWDLINFLIPLLFIFAMFLIFQIDAYSGRNAPAILLILLSYGCCMTPLMYCVEPLFSVPSTAYVTLIVTNIFTGTVSLLSTTVLDLYQTELPNLKVINDILKALYPWLLPNYNLGRGLMQVATNHYSVYAAEEFNLCPAGDGKCITSPLEWNVAGSFIFKLSLMSLVWFLLRLLIEWRCFVRVLCPWRSQAAGPRSGPQDEAVAREAKSVVEALGDPLSLDTNIEGSLLIHRLSKSFVPFRLCGCCRRQSAQAVHSVREVSVAVRGGECFGLLGVNGAGKTTTMRMITGDIEVGGGDVLLSGWSVRTHRDQARRHLGYCPQFDALPDKLSARETLEFYARIRGVSADRCMATVDAMIRRMCLEAHQNRLCQHLSGGNKRKLSTALALIGEPDVVLLDEPSTGVDVGARRFLWDVLGEVRQRGHALVLTSHSMDECEVLCTRLTIMVSGEMRCLGTPLQLKAKYGGGYTLAMKAKSLCEVQSPEETAKTDPRECIHAFMTFQVPEAKLAEENVGLFRYRLGGGRSEGSDRQKEVPLGNIFSALETAMAAGGPLHECILDYTLSQTSLEEVFLYFSQQ